MQTIINAIIWQEPLSYSLRFEDKVADIVRDFDVRPTVAEILIAMIDGQAMHPPHLILSGFVSAQDAFEAYGVERYAKVDIKQLDEIITGCTAADTVVQNEFVRLLNQQLHAAGVAPIKWGNEVTRDELARRASEAAATLINIGEGNDHA